MIIYESMSIDLDRLDLNNPTLQVDHNELELTGKRGNVLLAFNILEDNKKTIFTIVWGQCSQMMQAKLQSLKNYSTNKSNANCVWLLKEIKGITNKFEGTWYILISLDNIERHFRQIFPFNWVFCPECIIHSWLTPTGAVIQCNH